MNKKVVLSPIDRLEAVSLLNDLWKIVCEADRRLLPLYPDASWAYCSEPDETKKFIKAWAAMEKPLGRLYNLTFGQDQWLTKAFGDAEGFSDVGVAEFFASRSDTLFARYIEVANEPA